MDFYYSSPLPLGAGSIIEPGNWGRLVRNYIAQNGQVAINGLNEAALEFARLAYAPKKPSRLDCVFALETKEAAFAYRNMHHSLGIIYRVEPVAALTDDSLHVGDYQMAIQPHEGQFVPAMLDRFRSYWQDDHKEHREILLSSPVRILERLD